MIFAGLYYFLFVYDSRQLPLSPVSLISHSKLSSTSTLLVNPFIFFHQNLSFLLSFLIQQPYQIQLRSFQHPIPISTKLFRHLSKHGFFFNLNLFGVIPFSKLRSYISSWCSNLKMFSLILNKGLRVRRICNSDEIFD